MLKRPRLLSDLAAGDFAGALASGSTSSPGAEHEPFALVNLPIPTYSSVALQAG